MSNTLSAFLTLTDSYGFHFAALQRERRGVKRGLFIGLAAVRRVVDGTSFRETDLLPLVERHCPIGPAERVLHGRKGDFPLHAAHSLYLWRTLTVVVGRDQTDGRHGPCLQNAHTYFASLHLRETKDALEADVGGLCHFFPLPVYPCVHGMPFHPLAMSGHGFLQEDPVYKRFFR